MLKAEKDELSSELDKAQAARKVLQEEKDKLLQELAKWVMQGNPATMHCFAGSAVEQKQTAWKAVKQYMSL
jgi:hypothetical protein